LLNIIVARRKTCACCGVSAEGVGHEASSALEGGVRRAAPRRERRLKAVVELRGDARLSKAAKEAAHVAELEHGRIAAAELCA
jgi:hypothetical protein